MLAGLIVVLSAVLTAALCTAGPAVIARLPEPAPEADSADKLTYAEIATRPRLGAELAAAGALVGGLVGWRLGRAPVLAAWVFLSAVGVVLSYVDARTRLLPTRIIASSYAIVGTLICLAAVVDGDGHRLVRAAFGWLVMGGFYLVLWLIYPRGLGYGDVRLSGLIGLALGYVGWPALVTGVYAGFLLGGVAGGLLAMRRGGSRRHFAFGPFMLLGSVVGLVWGQAFADWYISR